MTTSKIDNVPPASASSRIAGSGEMADRMRSLDWSLTHLGPLETWSDSLVSAVNMMLAAPIPMQLLWGPALVVLYNDGLKASIADRHPSALGAPGREVWADAWHAVGQQLEDVLRLGRSCSFHDVRIPLVLNGEATDTYWDYSYSPMYEADGSIAGVLDIAQNTTESMLARQQLAASEARANRVLQSIGEAVMVADGNGRILQMNPIAEQLTQWSEEQARGRRLAEVFRIVDEETRLPLPDLAENVRRTGAVTSLSNHTVLIGRDNHETHIENNAGPIRSEAGDLIGLVLAFRAIDERRAIDREQKRAAALLQAAAARQTFLIGLSDRIASAETPREVLQISARALGEHLQTHRVGFSESSPDEELINYVTGWATAPLALLTGSQRIDDFSVSTATRLRSGESVVYADVRQDSSIDDATAYLAVGAIAVVAVSFFRAARWRGTLYVNHAEPRVWTMDEVGLIHEVAERTAEAVERRQVQQELRSVLERLNLAQSSARISTWEWDIPTGKLKWQAPEFSYGRPLPEVDTVQKCFEFIVPEDRIMVERALAPALAGTGEYVSELRIVWPDGSVHWALGRGQSVLAGADGKSLRMVGINMDITERKQSEAALIQNEKLAAVGRLASSIAHEINNPLESVTNLLYLAKAAVEPGPVYEYLEIAERELRRVSVISNQTLRFNKQSTRPSIVSCSDLFGEALSIYQGRLVNSRIRVEKRKRAERPAECFEGEIRQVLSNFISNAIDAMSRDGGRLLLRSRESTNWNTGQKGLTLTVADTGSGIAPRDQQKLFDAFYTTKGIAGTGLGLWISEEIAHRHHGKISFRTSQASGHSGTVFTLFLPFDAAAR